MASNVFFFFTLFGFIRLISPVALFSLFVIPCDLVHLFSLLALLLLLLLWRAPSAAAVSETMLYGSYASEWSRMHQIEFFVYQPMTDCVAIIIIGERVACHMHAMPHFIAQCRISLLILLCVIRNFSVVFVVIVAGCAVSAADKSKQKTCIHSSCCRFRYKRKWYKAERSSHTFEK